MCQDKPWHSAYNTERMEAVHLGGERNLSGGVAGWLEGIQAGG